MGASTQESIIHYGYILYLIGYILILVGVTFISDVYVLYLKNVIEFIISILLLYKFSFKNNRHFSRFDKRLIIISAWLLLSNTIFILIIQYHSKTFITKIKDKIDS